MLDCPPLLALSAKALPSQHGHADYHWRVSRPLARIRERGVDAAECWLDADERPTISPAGRLVILQRVAMKGAADGIRAWVRSLRDAGALAVVFEIDDDEISPACLDWMRSAGGLELVGLARLERERLALLATMQACDAVTVSTEPLAEVVRRYTDRPVHVVPNFLDDEWFTDRTVGGEAPDATPLAGLNGFVTIGWAGGRRPEADVVPIAEAWGRIARRYRDVRFVVSGWQPDCFYREVDDVDRIIRIPWQSLDRYPSSMMVDIGCVSVADTPFNRCKTPIKAWEFAAAGAAVIGSETLYKGEVQYWAKTTDDWEQHIAELIEDDGMREWLNGWGVGHVGACHSLAPNLPWLADVYIRIANGDSSGDPSQPYRPCSQHGYR